MTASTDFLSKLIPGFGNLNSSTSDVIKNLLTGNPNPGTAQNAAATFGAANGQGAGAGITQRFGYDLYNQQADARRQTGIKDLLDYINGISSPTLANQGQEIGQSEFNQNLGQRQLENTQNQANSERDFFENKRRFDEQNNPNRWHAGVDFTDIFGNKTPGYDGSPE